MYQFFGQLVSVSFALLAIHSFLGQCVAWSALVGLFGWSIHRPNWSLVESVPQFLDLCVHSSVSPLVLGLAGPSFLSFLDQLLHVNLSVLWLVVPSVGWSLSQSLCALVDCFFCWCVSLLVGQSIHRSIIYYSLGQSWLVGQSVPLVGLNSRTILGSLLVCR